MYNMLLVLSFFSWKQAAEDKIKPSLDSDM